MSNSVFAIEQMLTDCEALEYILLGDLRDLLEETPDRRDCKWLMAVLDTLLETLPKEDELQENSGGYLSEVVENFPNWSDEVDRLQQTRYELYEKLSALRHRISSHRSFSQIAEEVRIDLKDWMQAFVAQNRHERRILQTAFNLDVGIGD